MVKYNKMTDQKNCKDIVDLEDNGKHMIFHQSDLGFLSVDLFFEKEDEDFWFYEDFFIDKQDEDLYKMIDGLFFSYGGETFFATEGSNLKLTKEENGYKFKFIRNFFDKCKSIEAVVVDDTIENRSLNNLYSKLLNYEPVKQDKSVLKLAKSKKNLES